MSVSGVRTNIPDVVISKDFVTDEVLIPYCLGFSADWLPCICHVWSSLTIPARSALAKVVSSTPRQCRIKKKNRRCAVWITDMTSGFGDKVGPDSSTDESLCTSFFLLSSSSSSSSWKRLVLTHCSVATVIDFFFILGSWKAKRRLHHPNFLWHTVYHSPSQLPHCDWTAWVRRRVCCEQSFLWACGWAVTVRDAALGISSSLNPHSRLWILVPLGFYLSVLAAGVFFPQDDEGVTHPLQPLVSFTLIFLLSPALLLLPNSNQPNRRQSRPVVPSPSWGEKRAVALTMVLNPLTLFG